jgi:2-polyprenyl-3-methyl-5-hydroxy-6-metoxy-1,4-benzoquinol methylase
MIRWTACQHCGEPLSTGGGAMTCTGCGAELALEAGVLHAATEEYPYYGEVPSEVIRGWRDLMSVADEDDEPAEIFADHPWMRRYVFDRGRTDPLQLLGPLEGMRVLDVGCGWGLYSEQLARAGAEVVALDTTRERAEFTAARLARIDGRHTVLWGSLQDAPLRAGSFDAVLLVGVLEWMPEAQRSGRPEDVQRAVLRRVASLLRDGGRMMLCIENRFGAHYFLGRPEEHTGRRFTSLLPRRGAAAYLRRVQNGRGARTRTHSPRALARLVLEAGMQPRPPAYALPAYTLPRFIVGNERGQAHGMRVLLEDVIDLGRRHRALAPLQRLIARPEIGLRLSRAFAPSLILIADRGARAPRPNTECLVFTGPRPFNATGVTAWLDEDGRPLRYEKHARTAAGVRELAAEHEVLELAREAFSPEIAVPVVLEASERRLVTAALPGARLSAMTRHGLAAVVRGCTDVAEGLGSASARNASPLELGAVQLDPAVGPEARDRLERLARELGLDRLCAGFAHGDLHPANVLIAGDGRIGLVDWALAAERVPVAFDILYLVAELGRIVAPDRPAGTLHPAFDPALATFVRAAGLEPQELEAYVQLFWASVHERAGVPFDQRSRTRPEGAGRA